MSCCVCGAWVFGIIAYLFCWIQRGGVEFGKEAAEAFQLSSIEEEIVLGIALMGAIIGLIGGVDWSIAHKEARWRFIGWTVAWAVLGSVVATLLGEDSDYFDWVVWSSVIVGVTTGVVTALEAAGVFHKK